VYIEKKNGQPVKIKHPENSRHAVTTAASITIVNAFFFIFMDSPDGHPAGR
jgi:hypothetical protein